MSQIRLRLFGRNEITGRNFAAFGEGEERNINTSFDDEHLIRIISYASNEILLDNPGNVTFEFSVTGFANNDIHVYAKCEYQPLTRTIRVNNNWFIGEAGPSNKLVNDHPAYEISKFFNIRFHSCNFADNTMCRLDMRINDGEISSMIFTPAELLFINLDGDETQASINRLSNRFVEMEALN